MSGIEKRLFFSYARADAEFALRLATDLKSQGVSVWIDQLNIQPGERWDRSVEAALRSSPAFLVILSPDSVESANVMDEVSYALEERKTVIPVLHGDCQIPFRLRRLQRVDLASDYQRGLKRLVAFFKGKKETKPVHDGGGQGVNESSDEPATKREPAAPSPPLTAPAAAPRRRSGGALPGLMIGGTYGAVSAFLIYSGDARMNTPISLLAPVAAYGAVTAIAGAIAGAISGRSAPVLLPIGATVLAVIFAWIYFYGTYADVVATGMAIGGGMAAIIVATVWRLLRRKRRAELS